jgi:hypothetical protein
VSETGRNDRDPAVRLEAAPVAAMARREKTSAWQLTSNYQLMRKPSCVFRPSPAVEMTPAVTFEMFASGGAKFA